MSGWLFLALLALIFAAISAFMIRFGWWLNGRPWFYRAQHRWPSAAHPAHAAWLAMERVDEADLAAAFDRCMADLDALLEQEAR